MKKRDLFIVVFFGTLGWMTSCGRFLSTTENTQIKSDTSVIIHDSIAIIQAFENLKSNKIFLKDLGLEEETQFSWNDHRVKIISGDLDKDATVDVLLGFSIEGRGGGNNYDVHYAVLLREESQWKYSGQLDASVSAEDRFYEIQKIENGVIKGNWKGIKDENATPYVAEYVLNNGQFVNVFTALHQTENVEMEYLYVTEIITPENIAVRTTATVKEYEKLLGRGKIATPNEQPECGTYFDEGAIRYLDYPHFRFELNDANQAVLVSLELENGTKLQTDKGTITEKTKIEELKNIFYQKDSWIELYEENGFIIFAIPDGSDSDNQWHFNFDKSGKLIRVSLFIAC